MECPEVPHPMYGAADISQVPIEGWVINPNVHNFLNGPDDHLRLPAHYSEALLIDQMSSDVAVVMYR